MVAIGIDLGTTYSCVGVLQHGKVEIIANSEGNRTTPSYVAFKDNERLIGNAAKTQLALNLKNTVFDVKRLIGRDFDDKSLQADLKNLSYDVVSKDGKPMVQVNYCGEQKLLCPEEVSSYILNYLKDMAEKYLGEKVTDAVITVPAHFNDAQRQSTKLAGRLAGLNVLRVINEPTAAAIAYGIDKNHGKKRILVFDLGGGTFDVSLLDVDDNVFTVLATGGDTHLGGEDFDNLVTDHLAKEFNRKNKGLDVTTSQRAMKRLKAAAEVAKRTLSINASADIMVDSLYEGCDFSFTLSRALFERLCLSEFQKCMEPIRGVLADAKCDKGQVDEIVLVGGSTRIPKIQKLLSDEFGGKSLNNSVNPDEAVAYGAAVQAAALSGDTGTNLLLVDVAPLSLGVDTEHGRTDILIPRQSTIPTKKTKIYSTASHNQTGVTIKVYEGERPMTRDNNQLGEFQLEGIPPMPRGQPQIEVTFQLDANGILTVSAVEKTTGKSAKIEIKNDKGRLSEEDILQKIADAEKYKEQDEANIAKMDARRTLEQYLYGIDDSKDKMKGLSDEDKKELDTIFNEGQDWLNAHPDSTVEETQAYQKTLEPRTMALFSKTQPDVSTAQDGQTYQPNQVSADDMD